MFGRKKAVPMVRRAEVQHGVQLPTRHRPAIRISLMQEEPFVDVSIEMNRDGRTGTWHYCLCMWNMSGYREFESLWRDLAGHAGANIDPPKMQEILQRHGFDFGDDVEMEKAT